MKDRRLIFHVDWSSSQVHYMRQTTHQVRYRRRPLQCFIVVIFDLRIFTSDQNRDCDSFLKQFRTCLLPVLQQTVHDRAFKLYVILILERRKFFFTIFYDLTLLLVSACKPDFFLFTLPFARRYLCSFSAFILLLIYHILLEKLTFIFIRKRDVLFICCVDNFFFARRCK